MKKVIFSAIGCWLLAVSCSNKKGQAEENLRLNRDYYRAGTSRMSDLLEAQLLYQQSLDKHTDAFADYHNKLLEYRQAIGQ